MTDEKRDQILTIAEGIAALDAEEFQFFKGYQEGRAHERRKAERLQAALAADRGEGTEQNAS